MCKECHEQGGDLAGHSAHLPTKSVRTVTKQVQTKNGSGKALDQKETPKIWCRSKIQDGPVESKGSIWPASPNPAAESHLAPGGIPSWRVTQWKEGEQENPLSFNYGDVCSFCNTRGSSILIPVVGGAQSVPSTPPPRGWRRCYDETCLQGLQFCS